MKSPADYYEILEITREATEEEIRRAYRRLAMEWHPDRNKSDEAAEKFKEINEAYQILIDPQKREMYDRFGRVDIGGNSQGRGFEGMGFPGGFGDIFDAFFGGAGARRSTSVRRGDDLHYAFAVPFEEAVFGVDKEVEVVRAQACSMCNGRRSAPGKDFIRCNNCRGSGEVRRSASSFFGQFVQVVACNVCQGEGRVLEHPCPECKGVGRQNQRRKINVKIPAGVDDGTQLRITGEGEAGWNGGPPGNLFISLTVKPHAIFDRNGTDLVLEIPVNMAQAALGDRITIPLLGGGIEELKVPPGVQHGAQFRVKGKGVVSLNGGRLGDLLVSLKVVTPKRIDGNTKRLFEELSVALADEPLEAVDEKSWFGKFKDALGGDEV